MDQWYSCRPVSPFATNVIMALVQSSLGSALPLLASGKVRELYKIGSKSLLFVATDRISAFDVIMKNVSTALFGEVIQYG